MPAPVVASYSSAYGVASAYSTTVSKPTGTAEGDLLVAYVLTFGWGNDPTINTPSGWTKIGPRDADKYYGGNVHSGIFWKVAGASEPESYTWTNNGSGSTYSNVLLHRVTGADTTSPIDAIASVNTPNPATIYNFPSVDTTGPDRLLLLFGGLANNPVSTDWPLAVPTGFTRQAYINDTVEYVNLGSASKTQASSGSTGSFTVPFNDVEALAQGYTVAIKPAAGAASYAITASVSGAATISGSAGANRPGSGSSSGSASATGSAGASKPVSGSASGSSTSSADLGSTTPASYAISGSASGVSSVSGSASAFRPVSGAANGAASASGFFGFEGAPDSISGSAAGSSSVSGSVAAVRPGSGTAQGTASVLGQVGKSSSITGSVSGSATAVANAGMLSGQYETVSSRTLIVPANPRIFLVPNQDRVLEVRL